MTSIALTTTLETSQVPEEATVSGLGLLLMTGALAGSAFRTLRFEVGDLLVHPYLPVATLLGLWLLPARFTSVPRPVAASVVLFCVMYWVTSAPYSGGTGDIIKVVSSCATVVVVAVAIRSRRDFELGAAGLVFAGVVLSAYGLTGLGDAGPGGINPLADVANKNSFSLYALPALLMAVQGALRADSGRGIRLLYVGSAIVIVLALLATANRSGWAGAALILLMFLAQRGARFRSLAIAGAVAVAAATMLSSSATTSSVVDDRVDRTTGGYSSDTARVDLFVASMEVALENPVVGVGPQRLPAELARRVRLHVGRQVDPHNTVALLAGGGGFLTLFAFIALAGSLWRIGWRAGDTGAPLRMMLVLWAFRSLFTREILYSPAFSMGIGLCLGLVMISKEPHPA